MLKDLRNVVAMFGQAPRVDQDVIDVDQNEAMEVLSEHLMHEILEYSWLGHMAWPDIHNGR